MKFPFSRKVPLSTEAITAAAVALGDYEGHPQLAQVAVMAALRADMPAPLSLATRPRKSRIPLEADMIWLEGCTGSARHETSHALQRAAARAGYRTLTITPDGTERYRWTIDDMRAIDIIEDRRRLAEDVHDALSDLSRPCTLLRVPGWKHIETLNTRVAMDVLTALERVDVADMVIVWKDVDILVRMEVPQFMARLRSVAERAKAMICTSESGIDMVMAMSGPFDDVVLMRNVNAHVTAAALGLNTLTEGQGVLMTTPPVPVQGDYDGAYRPEPVLPEKMRALANRITAALAETPASTPSQRLNLVARCCGYRRWDAAAKPLRRASA